MDRRIADIFGCIQVEIAIIRFDDGRIRQTVIDHRIPISALGFHHWFFRRLRTKRGLWAPDINYINGQYVLYYSMSVWGGEWTCGIGVATYDKPEGPFIDKGPLFRSKTIQVQNSIDQFFMEDNGKKYLFWGSFRGIYGIELSGDGLSVRDGAKKKQVAGTAYEGTYIHKRGDYYYLFASIGSC